MKTINKTNSLLCSVLVLLLAGLSSCSKDKNDPVQDYSTQIVGKWVAIEGLTMFRPDNGGDAVVAGIVDLNGTTYTIETDGNWNSTQTSSEDITKGTYQISDNILILHFEETGKDLLWKIQSLDGHALTMTNDRGKDTYKGDLGTYYTQVKFKKS